MSVARILVKTDETNAIPEHSVNAKLITIGKFRELIRGMLKGGGVTSFIFGSSRSGKTTFMINQYLPLFNEFSTVIAFLPNSVAQVYEPLRNGEYVVMPELVTPLISDAVNFQKNQLELSNNEPIDTRFTFVLDDVTSDLFKNNNEVARCYTTYRNLGISTIVAAQYITMAKKESRANVNISIYFKLNTPEARLAAIKDHLPDLFASPGKTKMTANEKADAYQALTEEYIIISDNLNGQYYILPRSAAAAS